MSIVKTENYTWTNEHNNVTKTVFRRYQISNGRAGWQEGLAGIQAMIKEARSRNERVRSYGGKWSLTDVAICNDSIHDTKPLTFFGTVGKNSIKGAPLFKNDPKPLDQRLYYFQSGSQVNQINNVLESRGLCLATTGASNGQTIAGAVSTGTHGSALKIGAMPDYVRALHIVTSEKEHVFIQSATNPIIAKSFSDVFGAKLINDDSLFNSALVSFGSFGIIHGIVLETVSLFMLETYCKRVDYDKAGTVYPYLMKFNHGATNNLTQFLAQFGFPSNEDPYHLDIIANQYSATQNAFLRVMYKRPYDKTKLSPPPGPLRHKGRRRYSIHHRFHYELGRWTRFGHREPAVRAGGNGTVRLHANAPEYFRRLDHLQAEVRRLEHRTRRADRESGGCGEADNVGGAAKEFRGTDRHPVPEELRGDPRLHTVRSTHLHH